MKPAIDTGDPGRGLDDAPLRSRLPDVAGSRRCIEAGRAGAGGHWPRCGCRRANPRRQRGFSLLEVIAAVLLLAIAFAALMRVAGSSLNLTARAAERSQAAMWARSLLDSAFVLDPLKMGTRSGRFDKRYRWQLAVTPWNPVAGSKLPGQPTEPTVPLRMVRLDLDVLWDVGSHHYTAHFSTLRLRPAGEQGLAP